MTPSGHPGGVFSVWIMSPEPRVQESLQGMIIVI